MEGVGMCGMCSAPATDSNNQVTATQSAHPVLMQCTITWVCVGSHAEEIKRALGKLCNDSERSPPSFANDDQ